MMNKRFAKNIALDVFILWPLIFFGIILQLDYVSNIAIGYLWVMVIISLLMIFMFSDKRFEERAKTNKYIKRSTAHRYYQNVTTLLEIAAIFAVGRFWLG